MAGYRYTGTRPEPPLESYDSPQDRKRVNDARYRERNRERIRESAREWYAENKERVNARRRERYKLVQENR